MSVRIIEGHVLDRLRDLPDESVHMCVTSPPYWGLRDYKIPPQVWGGDPRCEHAWKMERLATEVGSGNWAQGTNGRGEQQPGGVEVKREPVRSVAERAFCRRCGAWRGSLGLEPTPALYLDHVVAVFREVRRVLRRDGTLWLNLGDAYGSGKQLLMMPARLALALQADDWWLRSDIIWAKRAPMPESVTDRPTSAHEHVFLLTKSARYFYDAEAVAEPCETAESENYPARAKITGRGEQGFAWARGNDRDKSGGFPLRSAHSRGTKRAPPSEAAGIGHEGWHASMTRDDELHTRNIRNFWLLGPEPFPEAHFATFPTEIPRRAILAGTSVKGVCPQCAAPWARAVDREPRTDRPNSDGVRRVVVPGQRPQRGNRYLATETLGWRPTCRCAASAPVPATVLDPFLGSGTTALVADQLQRDCIGIELSADYAAMTRRRIEADAPLFLDLAAAE